MNLSIFLSVSIMLVTSMIGNALAGILCETLGRKSTLILGNAIVLAAWIVTHFAATFGFLFAARSGMGVGFGISSASSYVLLGEISTAAYRGSLGTLNSFARNFGLLCGIGVGALLPFEYYIIGKYVLNQALG